MGFLERTRGCRTQERWEAQTRQRGAQHPQASLHSHPQALDWPQRGQGQHPKGLSRGMRLDQMHPGVPTATG